jgi:hypothetical protein
MTLDHTVLRTLCHAYLAGYKVPKEIGTAPEVLRSAAGQADTRKSPRDA